MNAKRRMSAYDISKSRFLSKTFIVAIIRHPAGTRIGSDSVGASTPDGTNETGRICPFRRNGSTTGEPDNTVKSCPKALSKFDLFNSSITSHRPLSIASTNNPGRKISPSAVGCRPPMVSNVVHSVVAVVGRYPVHIIDRRATSADRYASVVLPVPGGPVRTMCLPESIAATIWSTTWAGRIRPASSTASWRSLVVKLGTLLSSADLRFN